MMLLVRPGDAFVITVSGDQLPKRKVPSPRFVSDIHTNHAAMGTEVTRNTKRGLVPRMASGYLNKSTSFKQHGVALNYPD